MELLFFILLGLALLGPPALLALRERRLSWSVRYSLSLVPFMSTWAGYQLGKLAYDLFECQGGMKNIQGCSTSGLDVTALVDLGVFLGIPCLFIGAPISLWFLVDTGVKHAGQWNKGA